METTRKLLIQMSGPPGSGKSTLANLLARHPFISAVVINHDTLKSSFLEQGQTFQSSASLAYDTKWSLAETSLKQGRNVVIDSTCNHTATLEQGTALAQRYNNEYVYVECKLAVSDIDLLEERLRNRVALRSQRTSIYVDPVDSVGRDDDDDARGRFVTWIENPVRPSPRDGSRRVTVDSTKSAVDCLHSALKQMCLGADGLLAEGLVAEEVDARVISG